MLRFIFTDAFRKDRDFFCYVTASTMESSYFEMKLSLSVRDPQVEFSNITCKINIPAIEVPSPEYLFRDNGLFPVTTSVVHFVGYLEQCTCTFWYIKSV